MSKYDGTHSSLTISLPAVSLRSLPMWKVFRSTLKFVLSAVIALGSAAAEDLAEAGTVSGALVERHRHRAVHLHDQRHGQRAGLSQ